MITVNRIFDELFERYPSLFKLRGDILRAYETLSECYENAGKLLVCGNGGSAADCDHIVGELMKGFRKKRVLAGDDERLFGGSGLGERLQGALPAISLTAHAALCTAFANDVDPDMIFAQQVWAYSKNSPDVLLALSTVGSSKNVINAVKVANAIGIKSVGITGDYDSELSRLCTLCIRLPEAETYKVQELTLPLYHAICAVLEEKFF
ncbi:MAG: SIS domain-containing protein [Oscillospiraceae bacterium]|nr:SIS domain-containing protein [Oscillospiraceae bacterium]